MRRNSNAKDGVHGSSNNGHGDKLITDARFASVHSDPRFQNAPKHKSKVEIDSRFNRMFTDKSFSSSSTRIDKRGKPKKEKSQNPLKHYYRLDEEEEDRNKKGNIKVEKEDVQSDDESESESESEIEKLQKGGPKPSDFKLRSKRALSESESEDEDDDDVVDSDTTSTSTTDSDEDNEIYSEEEETLAQEENVPPIDKETHRLAVVNMDWNQVKAVDLYVLLSSFLPKGGQILSVAVYPSEFGLKRMEEEAVHGPVGLFDDDEDKNASDEDDEIDNGKLRAYELSRLRYYYAVVVCDSIATADYLYKACDGVEFERSSNKLDLRFIPDSMEFKHDPRDVATEAPPSYEGIDFHTQALQQSKIQLTWDEDEPHRSKTLKRKFNADQLAEMEWKELLASDEGETDEDESDNPTEDKSEKRRKKQDLYRSLIQSGDGSDEEEEENDKQEMEVTFNTDLEDISKRILEKKDKQSESVWEAYLRERREKKKARKNRRNDSSEDESSDDNDRGPVEQPDDFFVEEVPAKVSKKAGGKARKGKRQEEIDEETKASRAELELLLADDKGGETNLKGYNLKHKKAKGKKGKEIPDEGKIPTVDYDDPRFSSLFTSPLFALDPTDPQFKRSAAYARQIAQKQQKVDREEMGRKQETKLPAEARTDRPEMGKDENLKSDGLPLKKEKHELSSLVKSIKMKSKQVQPPSKGSKVSGKKGKRQF
ncbi:hypothetical protein LguiA_005683 [Lonicera macranthoides]